MNHLEQGGADQGGGGNSSFGGQGILFDSTAPDADKTGFKELAEFLAPPGSFKQFGGALNASEPKGPPRGAGSEVWGPVEGGMEGLVEKGWERLEAGLAALEERRLRGEDSPEFKLEERRSSRSLHQIPYTLKPKL